MRQRIKRIAPGKFGTHGPLGYVALNFNPVIEAGKLEGDFVLGHWNRMLCLPAFYDSATDSYHVAQEDRIVVNAAIEWTGIPKLENPGVLPTSCNLHRNARLTVDDGLLLIQEVPNGVTADL